MALQGKRKKYQQRNVRHLYDYVNVELIARTELYKKKESDLLSFFNLSFYCIPSKIHWNLRGLNLNLSEIGFILLDIVLQGEQKSLCMFGS